VPIINARAATEPKSEFFIRVSSIAEPLIRFGFSNRRRQGKVPAWLSDSGKRQCELLGKIGPRFLKDSASREELGTKITLGNLC
jgi:hypothetical protein